MVFDIVEECFYLQMVDDSKTKKTEALIDETAAFQDEVLGKISKFKTKKGHFRFVFIFPLNFSLTKFC